MGTFDSFADSPFQIRTEGQEITIIFARTGETTGRISWNIPPPALGCNADQQAYNGIVVTIDSTGTAVSKQPVDKTVYTADPTGNEDLHAGDKIGTSLVVGAFYEDKVTTFLDITGLTSDQVVYASGFAVDAQNRYHTAGVHSYSLDYEGGNEKDPIASAQYVVLGVDGTDPTLLTGETEYNFTLNVDGTEHDLTVNGTDSSTYDQLVAAINKEIALTENPIEDVNPPNAGEYYWNSTTERLFLWDGYENVEQTVIAEDTAPNTPATGDYWYNPTTEILYQWNGASWDVQVYINYYKDPTALNGSDYWFDGTNAYVWDGNTWCQNPLSNQTVDPSLPVLPEFGTYWYDTVNLFLNKWNDQTVSWDAVDAIYWGVDPNALAVNTYWYDETNAVVNQWDGSAWNLIAATISSTEPPFPPPNSYWYNPDTEELKQRNPANTAWVDLTILVFADDPTDRTSCGLWWNSATDLLYVWDIVTASWDQVTNFLQQATDPAAAPTLPVDHMWYEPTTMILYRWDGSMWVTVNYIDYPTDPTLAPIDTVWFDSTNSLWYERSGSPLSWMLFDPIDATSDPSIPTTGTFWFDTTNTILYQWTGSPGAWVSIPFSTIPLTPVNGTLWFNLNDDVMYEWSSTAWIVATLIATAEMSGGDIKFTSATKSSQSLIIITDGDLFSSLTPAGQLSNIIIGADGIDPEPMYAQLGVGTDGTVDERRELMDSIRAQLGYPVVDVELTKYQMDTAITAALESLRKRSSAAYNRTFFFVDIPVGEQAIFLTDKTVGFNKVVNVLGAYRVTSAFLSTAFGSGVYGQIALQHLYTMGTFDLLSYHLVASYIEELEVMFATRLVYNWNEQTRLLAFHQTFGATGTINGLPGGVQAERILLDASIERTEQELLADRWTKSWIEKYASAQARLMLAEIRGKYASLPGAGGGVSLNAGELISRADIDMADCYQQLEDYVVNPVEEYGIGVQFTIG